MQIRKRALVLPLAAALSLAASLAPKPAAASAASYSCLSNCFFQYSNCVRYCEDEFCRQYCQEEYDACKAWC